MQTSSELFTPDSFAGYTAHTIYIPDDETGRAAILWALAILATPDTWQEYGTMTPEDASLVFLRTYERFTLEVT